MQIYSFFSGLFSFLKPFSRVAVFVSFATFVLWVACAPPGTPCKKDTDCPTDSFCAATNKTNKFCVKKQDNKDGGLLLSDQTNPPQSDKTNPPQPDKTNPPQPDKTNPPQPDKTNPPQPDKTNPPQPDKTNPPPDTGKPRSGCSIKPYNPATDPGNGGKKTTLDVLDKAFFIRLRKIYYASKNCYTQIWGGKYQMHKIPTYIVNIGSGEAGTGKGVRGFLINHPNPPSSAVLIDSKLVYGIPNVYLHNADKKKVPSPGFAFGMKVEGLSTYAFEYGNRDSFIDPTKGREVFAFFVHEGFHRVQEIEESWKEASGNQDTSHYPMNANAIALALLEGRVLLDAYNGADAKVALELFYAIQFERLKADKTGIFKAHDTLQEWLEGTAQYAEHLHLIAIGDGFPDTDVNSIPGRLKFLETLMDDPRFKPSKDDLVFSFTARFYATGAMLGLLLERAGDKGWKDKIRKGQTFHTILQQRFPGLNTAQKLQQAKAKYPFSKLLALGQKYAKVK